MNKKQSEEKIIKLVERYDKLSEADKKRYNERQTIEHFIRPLFEALGWDFEEDAWPETDVSGKRVDYAIKHDGITKFFIEAKQLSVNLDEERWAEQAIDYSWHKSVPWVVLTDFEAIKVFNTEWDDPNVQSCRFIEISYKDFPTDERLWWLSKEAFIEGVLDKEADKLGRRPKTIIDKQLASDLSRWRDSLYAELKAYNTGMSAERISKYVQIILNRLIFIRTLEDRKIEDVILKPLVHDYEKSGGKNNFLLQSVNKLFVKWRGAGWYDSELFDEDIDLGGALVAEDYAFKGLIDELYKTKDKGIRYNFADIPSDIFGSIYEQYLGHIQKGEKEPKTSKRKSQGIYYTPRYIVDYIVQNTLGEVLKDKKPEEIQKLKILDPACGSGSFLTSAYQKLIDYWEKQKIKSSSVKKDNRVMREIEKHYKEKKGTLITQEQKMRILLDNIYGVDLDKEATELARLNLTLKMVDRRIKLPNLTHNIQNGNSLISGSEEELVKYFGKNWRDKKPFNWEEKFSGIFEKGGFDIIIGNPPYVGWAKGKQSREDKDYYSEKFEEVYSGKNDLFYYFIYNSLQKLKPNGKFSFIVSRYFIESIWAQKLRDFIVDNFYIDSLVDFRETQIFEGVGVHTLIITITNRKIKNNNIRVLLDDISNQEFYVDQSELFGKVWRLTNTKENNIIKKIENNSESVLDYFDIKDTKLSALDKVYILTEKQIRELGLEKKYLRRFIASKDIGRYFCKWGGKYLIDLSRDTKLPEDSKLYKYLKENEKLIQERNKKRKENLGWGLARPMDNYDWDSPKLFCPSRSPINKFILDNDKSTGSRHNITVLFPKTNKNLLFFLALFNSKLFDYYFKTLAKQIGNSYEYLPQYLEKIRLKVKDISKNDFNFVVNSINKILKLNQEAQKVDAVLDKEKYESIEEEIDKIDKSINERVYKLYSISGEEEKIVEA